MASSGKSFPYEIKKISAEENKEINDSLKGLEADYVRVSPKGYFMLEGYEKEAANIYSMEIRSDDVFVVTYPKSGTTWTQEMVWLIMNDLNYEKAKNTLLGERFPFLEESTFPFEKHMQFANFNKAASTKNILPPWTVDRIREMPSPRYIKTHLPLSLLPPTLTDKAKVVYVARDPRDVAVSFYHHSVFMRLMAPDVDFKTYWERFYKNQVLWSPLFEHLLEAWEKRDHPNLLFLFYEELSMDLPASIRRIAKFLGRELTNDEVAGLQEHVKFDNFKKNKSVNMQDMKDIGVFRSDGQFVRKGKMGNWREYFDDEMTAQAQKWIDDNILHTDFRFVLT